MKSPHISDPVQSTFPSRPQYIRHPDPNKDGVTLFMPVINRNKYCHPLAMFSAFVQNRIAK